MVSRRKLPKMRAGQTQDIRIEAVFGNVPINIMSTHPLVLLTKIAQTVQNNRPISVDSE